MFESEEVLPAVDCSGLQFALHLYTIFCFYVMLASSRQMMILMPKEVMSLGFVTFSQEDDSTDHLKQYSGEKEEEKEIRTS